MQILALVGLAVLVQFLHLPVLFLLASVILLAAMAQHGDGLRRMLRRSRFLLVTLALIYAFSTPGEYVRGWPTDFAPTYEGLSHGALQILRLATILGALVLLLARNTRDNLMAGIYCLIAPLRLLGLHPDRFAARLWLTLHYIEQAPPGPRKPLWDALDNIDGYGEPETERNVHIPVPAMKGLDWAALCGMCAIGILFGWPG